MTTRETNKCQTSLSANKRKERQHTKTHVCECLRAWSNLIWSCVSMRIECWMNRSSNAHRKLTLRRLWIPQSTFIYESNSNVFHECEWICQHLPVLRNKICYYAIMVIMVLLSFMKWKNSIKNNNIYECVCAMGRVSDDARYRTVAMKLACDRPEPQKRQQPNGYVVAARWRWRHHIKQYHFSIYNL